MSSISMLKKQAVVIHSGGMDSSLCLALALREFPKEQVLSLSFSYCQRHTIELQQAAKISSDWGVDHLVLNIDCMEKITTNALTHHHLSFAQEIGKPPNTLVVGRNGLMARIGAIHANNLGAHCIYMGVMGLEGANSGYRDCSREYMDLLQHILRIDLDDSSFEIRTPLVHLMKEDTLEIGDRLGILTYLWCEKCPACVLRNEGLRAFVAKHPEFECPYLLPNLDPMNKF
jgi:7-cyano-7-deazaguanine synthase